MEVALKYVFAYVVQGYNQRLTLMFDDGSARMAFNADNFCRSSPAVFILAVRLSPDIANSTWKQSLWLMYVLLHGGRFRKSLLDKWLYDGLLRQKPCAVHGLYVVGS